MCEMERTSFQKMPVGGAQSHLGQDTYAQELTVHTFPIHTQMQACSWSDNTQKQRLQNDSSSHITYSATTQYSKVPRFLFNSQNRQRTGIARNTTPEKWWSLDRQIYSYVGVYLLVFQPNDKEEQRYTSFDRDIIFTNFCLKLFSLPAWNIKAD